MDTNGPSGKRSRPGTEFAPLDNGFRACEQAERLAAICDSLSRARSADQLDLGRPDKPREGLPTKRSYPGVRDFARNRWPLRGSQKRWSPGIRTVISKG
jgi:hypothetical protein